MENPEEVKVHIRCEKAANLNLSSSGEVTIGDLLAIAKNNFAAFGEQSLILLNNGQRVTLTSDTTLEKAVKFAGTHDLEFVLEPALRQ